MDDPADKVPVDHSLVWLALAKPCAITTQVNLSLSLPSRYWCEIEADREVLVGVIERTGHTPGAMKELGARLAEKVSRLKLKPGSAEGLGPVSCQRNSRTRPAFQNLERPSV